MPAYDTGRIRHAMDLMHYSKASNGSSIPSNWIPAATGDSGIGWQPAPSGGGSAGSNSSYIAEIPLVGTGTAVALATHYHGGVGQITSSSSNTLQRGTVNLRAGTNVGFAATDTDGDGEFDTLTISASVTGSGGGGSSSSGWPLDSYAIDGTYGDHFASNSLAGKWTRRNFTSGAETYLQGKNGTYIRIDPTGRAVGDGYFQTAKSGDWTIATKIIHIGPGAHSFGPAVVDTNGTGIAALVYNAPLAPILTRITTYSTYQGTYVEVGSSGTNPNLNQLSAAPFGFAVWMYIRRDSSANNYYFAYSLNGEIWSHESGALNATFTVDRFGFIVHPLGTVDSRSRYDVDWFNVIA